MPLTAFITLTVQLASKPPSFVFAVIVVLPVFTPLTTPSLSTVATDVSEEVHSTVLSLATSGLIFAFNAILIRCIV